MIAGGGRIPLGSRLGLPGGEAIARVPGGGTHAFPEEAAFQSAYASGLSEEGHARAFPEKGIRSTRVARELPGSPKEVRRRRRERELQGSPKRKLSGIQIGRAHV